MTRSDQAIRALRGDLALQIARHIGREGQTQVATAKHGQVKAVSLELMLKIAVRAGLSVVLQTGKDAAEAGVYVSGITQSKPARIKSRLAEEARLAVSESVRSLSSEQRLEAHLKLNSLVTELRRAGMGHSETPTRRTQTRPIVTSAPGCRCPVRRRSNPWRTNYGTR